MNVINSQTMRPMLVAPVAMLLACSTNVGTVSVSVVLAPGEEEAFVRDVSWIRVGVKGPDLDLSSDLVPVTERAGHLDHVPPGSDRQIVVEGLDPDESVVYRGTSVPLEIGSGVTSLALFVGRVDTFSYIANEKLTVARAFHQATLLDDGSVLLTGGITTGRWRPELGGSPPTPTDTAEIIDGNALRTTSTKTMVAQRFGHTATLNAKGNVLVAGGAVSPPQVADGGLADGGPGGSSENSSFVELFDPINRKFVKGVPLRTPRAWHAGVLTAEGVILMGGATDTEGATRSVEAYTDGSLRPLPNLRDARRAFAVTVLDDGRVVVSGGLDREGRPLRSIEVWTPGSTAWQAGPSMSVARAYHTGTLLKDGTVLLTGGLTNLGSVLQPTSLVERLEPGRNRVSQMETHPRAARWCHTATLLQDGTVLLAGGFLGGSPSTSVDEIRVVGDVMQLTPAPAMRADRAGHTATLLPSGALLVTGGVSGADRPNNTAEVFVH